MIEHDGQLIENAIRRNGYSITELASELSVNRRTIYNWFTRAKLKPKIITEIARALRHDFSKDFPEINFPEVHSSLLTISNTSEDSEYQDKYIALLEAYNKLIADEIKSGVPNDEDAVNATLNDDASNE